MPHEKSGENFVSPSESLMTKEGVITLMKSSKSDSEWSANCDKVQKANNGYPDFWHTEIVSSGLATETTANYGGGTAEIKMTSFSSRPLENIFGRPTVMPSLSQNEKVIGIYDQGVGEKRMECKSLSDMQSLYDSYASGMALRLRWEIQNSK